MKKKKKKIKKKKKKKSDQYQICLGPTRHQQESV